jgi:cytochrome c oxidase subunit 2
MNMLGLTAVMFSGGCAGDHAIFAPIGPGAQAISQLGWLLIAVCALVNALTLIVFFFVVARALRRSGPPNAAPHGESIDRNKTRWVAVALAVTTVVLSGLVAASFIADRRLSLLGAKPSNVEVELIAHQWWWEIRYLDATSSRGFVTANELHLPRGEPVSLKLESQDVIHSLWIPNIDRKRDIIPGHEQSIQLVANALGTWQGRCAEYCGYQHAHMDLLAIVESPQDFERWRSHQIEPASTVSSQLQERGAEIFSKSFCGTCHVIRGSDAPGYSATAPDLTHIASRQTLAAGALPNTEAMLGAWIRDPQHFKPGVKMAVNELSADDHGALLSYLEILK